MATTTPLIWELQFALKDGGSSLSTTTKLIDGLSLSVSRLEKTISSFDKASQSFSKQTSSSTAISQQRKAIAAIDQMTAAYGRLERQISQTNKQLAAGKAGAGSTSRVGVSHGGSSGSSLKNAITNKLSGFASGGLSSASGGMASMSGGMSGTGMLGGMLGKAGVPGAAVALIGKGVSAFFSEFDEFTKEAVDTISKRSISMRSYTMMLGSAKAAEKEYYSALNISQKTDLSFEQTQAMQSKLIGVGMRDDKLQNTLLNLTDVVSMVPKEMQAQTSTRLTDLFSKVQSKGFIQRGEMIKQIAPFGLNQTLDELAKQQKKDPSKFKKEFFGAAQAPKIAADDFFKAFQTASMNRFGTTKLGEAAMGASGTLSGLLSNKEEAQKNVLKFIGEDDLIGIRRYKESIQKLTDLYDINTKKGKGMLETMSFFASMGTLVESAFTSFKTGFLDQFVTSFTATMGALGLSSGDAENEADRLTSMMEKLGWLLGNVGYVAGFLISGLQRIGYFFGHMLPQAFWRVISFFQDIFYTVVGNIKMVFNGIKDYFIGMATIIKGVVTLSFDTIKEGAAKMSAGASGVALGALLEGYTDTSHTKATIAKNIQDDKDYKNLSVKKVTDVAAKKAAKAAAMERGAGFAAGSSSPTSFESGKKDTGGFAVNFNYASGGGMSAMGAIIPQMATPYMLQPAVIPPSMQAQQGRPVSATTAPSTVININVNVGKASATAQEIADEIWHVFGRLNKSPSARVL